MAVILQDYLMTRNDECNSLFVNGKARSVSVSWLQRLVKTTGEQAGLPCSLICNHLRHTFATYAADQHGKVITKALMGHQRLAEGLERQLPGRTDSRTLHRVSCPLRLQGRHFQLSNRQGRGPPCLF
jgi:hypothetical protein